MNIVFEGFFAREYLARVVCVPESLSGGISRRFCRDILFDYIDDLVDRESLFIFLSVITPVDHSFTWTK